MKKTLSSVRREEAEKAMPEVKKIVKKFGRVAVARCIKQLQLIAAKERKIELLRDEAERLERAIK